MLVTWWFLIAHTKQICHLKFRTDKWAIDSRFMPRCFFIPTITLTRLCKKSLNKNRIAHVPPHLMDKRGWNWISMSQWDREATHQTPSQQLHHLMIEGALKPWTIKSPIFSSSLCRTEESRQNYIKSRKKTMKALSLLVPAPPPNITIGKAGR